MITFHQRFVTIKQLPLTDTNSISQWLVTYVNHIHALLNAISRIAFPSTTESQVGAKSTGFQADYGSINCQIFSLTTAHEESSDLRWHAEGQRGDVNISSRLKALQHPNFRLCKNGIQKYPLSSTQQLISNWPITKTNFTKQNDAHC
jgi:hypothetical protein